ncbi:hypothetical protein L228DRAFT_58407 [Xylona heveae TC161]|uniref:Uncharacterized protein n=1 Tax=Xylona heveae (strain CBS 132557 / TC161) TaxID=1328760 RepID=A0A165IHS8_XYLHT|nr:hypothetical protein L228DRAFT_58407 [Xylona heveae TC161]KZF24918.1 hypothetical protein L228DRAFT_58407 [Xylona heveae TC161]
MQKQSHHMCCREGVDKPPKPPKRRHIGPVPTAAGIHTAPESASECRNEGQESLASPRTKFSERLSENSNNGFEGLQVTGDIHRRGKARSPPKPKELQRLERMHAEIQSDIPICKLIADRKDPASVFPKVPSQPSDKIGITSRLQDDSDIFDSDLWMDEFPSPKDLANNKVSQQLSALRPADKRPGQSSPWQDDDISDIEDSRIGLDILQRQRRADTPAQRGMAKEKDILQTSDLIFSSSPKKLPLLKRPFRDEKKRKEASLFVSTSSTEPSPERPENFFNMNTETPKLFGNNHQRSTMLNKFQYTPASKKIRLEGVIGRGCNAAHNRDKDMRSHERHHEANNMENISNISPVWEGFTLPFPQ